MGLLVSIAIWFPDEIKPELSLEAKVLKLRLSYVGHIIMRKQNSLERTLVLGKVEGSRKRGGPNTRWTGSLKEATGLGLQDPSRAVEDRIFLRVLIHRVALSWGQLGS